MNSEIIEKNYQGIMHCHNTPYKDLMAKGNYLLDAACKFDHMYDLLLVRYPTMSLVS